MTNIPDRRHQEKINGERERNAKRRELITQLDFTREQIQMLGIIDTNYFGKYDDLKAQQRYILAQLATL